MKLLQSNKILSTLLFVFCFISVPLWASSQSLRYYRIDIQLPKDRHISGICIIRTEGNDGAMSVINEFGIKAFDAVYQKEKNKIKLQHVIGPLNKWYKRKIIAKDMRLFFNPEENQSRHRNVEYNKDGSILLQNKRFNIIYHLQPMKEEDVNK